MPRLSHSLLLVLSLFAFGCANSTTPAPVGGETHFLHSCEGDTCGLGLDCVCGVCTKPCVGDNACGDLNGNATCEAAGTPIGACVSPQANPVCEVKCTADIDCETLGAGYTCESGSCRKLDGDCVVQGVVYPNHTTTMRGCTLVACEDGSAIYVNDACPTDGGMDATVDAGMDAGSDSGGNPELDATLPSRCTTPDDDDGGARPMYSEQRRVAPPLCAGAAPVLQQPGVAFVANGPVYYGSFEVTDTDVYWYDGQALVRAELSGTRSWLIDGLGTNITAFAVDDCQVYVGTRNVFRLEIDPSYVYRSFWNTLTRQPRNGGNVEVLRTSESSTNPGPPIALLEDRVLWVEYTGPEQSPTAGSLLSISKANTSQSTTVAAAISPPPSDLVTDDEFIYISTYIDPTGPAPAFIFRIPLAGGALDTVMTSSWPIISADVDETHLYWIEGERGAGVIDYVLRRAPKTNPASSVVIAHNAQYFRLTDTHVYWRQFCESPETTTSEYFIARIAKSML